MSRFSGVWVAAFLSAALLFANAVGVIAADEPPPPKSAGPAAPRRAASQPPMITKNPDGTFTVQKVPPKGFKDNNKGLVIPPQVVVPLFILPPKKTQNSSPHQKPMTRGPITTGQEGGTGS
jgi:hypothetical protein